jgi:PBP1b-binding outer membrane lipoprotein LpoB
MTRLRIISSVVAITLVLAACGGGQDAANCEEIADQTIDLIQALIDDVDSEAATISLQEFVESRADLPSLEAFDGAADAIEERSGELGCNDVEVAADVASQLGALTAESELGRFVIDLLVSGGL